MSNLPTFLIVGAPKAGTTALPAALSRHPEVFRKATPEDATQRWAEADELKPLSEELLPAEIFEHWTHLSIQRGLDEERRR